MPQHWNWKAIAERNPGFATALVCFALGLLYPTFLLLGFAFILPCVYEDFEIIGTRERYLNASSGARLESSRSSRRLSSTPRAAAQAQPEPQQPSPTQADTSAPPSTGAGDTTVPKFIPWGSPTLRVRDLHGNVITINSDEPVPFESEYFKGVILVMVRQENGRWEPHFQGKQRKIEVQVQGQIKKPVGPNIIMGAELQEKLEMGLVTRALVNILMAFCGKLINNFRYSFGEPYNKDGNFEVPYVCFPMFRTMDRVVITPEGEAPPQLGSELPEPDADRNLRRSGKSSGENLKFEMGKTYSFSFHSMYINFAEWAIINVPGYKAIDIKSIIQTQPARVVIYDIEENQKHYSKNKRYIMYADFCHISIMSEHELSEYNRRAAAAAAAAATLTATAATTDASEQPSAPFVDDIVARPTELSPEDEVSPEDEEEPGDEDANIGEPKQSGLELDENMRRSLVERVSKTSSLLSTMAYKDDQSSVGDQDDALADVPSNSFVPITILHDSSSLGSAISNKTDSTDNSMWSGIGSSSSFAVMRDFEEVQSVKFIKLSAKGSTTPKRRTMVPWRSSRDRNSGPKTAVPGQDDKRGRDGDTFWGKNNREVVKSERLRNGDVVHIQSAATGEYLTIHRGWWLVWTSRVPHDKKGQFIVTIMDYDNSIKASPSPVFVGFPFRLRSHRWPSWQIGCQVIPSTSYGGRLLTLFHTPRSKNGDAKHEEAPPGASNPQPPAQNQSGKQSVQPLVLCVLPDSVCERHSRETERLIRHVIALNMFSRNKFFLGMRPQNALSAVAIPAKADSRRPSNASSNEGMSEQAGFRYFTENLLEVVDLQKVRFELTGYVELLNRRTNQLQLMYMLYCEIPSNDKDEDESSSINFSKLGNQVIFDDEAPSSTRMKSFVVLRSGNQICDTLRLIADSFSAVMDAIEPRKKSHSITIEDDNFSDGEPFALDDDCKSPQGIDRENSERFDFDFICSNHQSSADESFQLLSSMIYFAQKKDRVSSKPDSTSYPARRNLLKLVAFESDYLTDSFANADMSPMMVQANLSKRSSASAQSGASDSSRLPSTPSPLLQTTLVARAAWDSYWREEIVQLYSQYMVFYPLLPTDSSKSKASSKGSKGSEASPERSGTAGFTILLADINSVCVLPSEYSKFPGFHILKIESVGRSTYIAFRKLDACRRFMASVLESKSNILSSMSDVSDIPADVAVVDPRDSFVHRSGRWRPHTRMLLNSRRFFFDTDQARRMSLVNPSSSGGKYLQLSYGGRSSAASSSSVPYWELSEKLLRDVHGLAVSMGAPSARSASLSSSPSSNSTFLEAMKGTDGERSKGMGTDKLSTFLDDVSILKLVDLTAIDYSSREAVCFFGNIYHALLLHARLVLGSPSEDSWSSFFDSVSYEIGGEVFSLVELEQCVLRGKLTRPMFIPKIGYTPPCVDDSRYEYALSAVDERISFFMNQGSISGPDCIYVLTPESLDEQLNEASRNALEFCLDINTAKRTVSLPFCCQIYAGDFIGVDANEMDETGANSRADLLLLKRCMRYMGARQSENIIHLLTLPALPSAGSDAQSQSSRRAPTSAEAAAAAKGAYNSLTTSSEGSEVTVLYMPLEYKSHPILTVK